MNLFYNVLIKEEQTMARKMKTMDGNQAAAHVSYEIGRASCRERVYDRV